MRKVAYSVSGVLSASLLLVSFSSPAQVVDISSCRAIEDRLERFDCFESLGAAEAAPAAAPAPSAAPAAPAAAPRTNLPVLRLPARAPAAAQPAQAPTPAPATAPQAESGVDVGNDVDSFGKTSASGARVVQDEDGKAELTDTVAAVEQVGPSLALITLKSGQQWRQSITKRYLVEAGDEVRIYPSMWGKAYRLSVKRLGGFIQVERVK